MSLSGRPENLTVRVCAVGMGQSKLQLHLHFSWPMACCHGFVHVGIAQDI
jgi:hypothetical protein